MEAANKARPATIKIFYIKYIIHMMQYPYLPYDDVISALIRCHRSIVHIKIDYDKFLESRIGYYKIVYLKYHLRKII